MKSHIFIFSQIIWIMFTSALFVWTIQNLNPETFNPEIKNLSFDSSPGKTSAITGVQASTCTNMYTLKEGLWNDVTVWSCNRIPTELDTVSVKHVITIPTSYTAYAKKVNLDGGKVLKFDAGSKLVFTGITSCTTSFDSNAEGWTILGDATSATPVYSTTGGNPGGYIYSVDRASGDVWYFVASASFVNCMKNGYGKTLRFDLKQSSLSSQFNDDDVILVGNNLTLTFDTPTNPGLNWTSYSVKLDETAGWKRGNVSATQAEIQGVIQNLTRLQIRGEYRSGSDTGSLDNPSVN